MERAEECLVFKPSLEEWRDSLAYIQIIQQTAAKHGELPHMTIVWNTLDKSDLALPALL